MAKDKKRKLKLQEATSRSAAGKKAKTGDHHNSNHNSSSSSSSQKPSNPLHRPQRQHKQKQQHADPIIPFDVHDRILVLGDGDLSFSRALVEHHGCADLTATTYDHHDELLEKYPQAAESIAYLEEEGQTVMHGVDATRLAQKELRRKGQLWDRVVFNFPHVGGKSKDVNRQVRYNQEMLVEFFKTAAPLLASDGTIIVTLFEGEPYTLWNIRDLARHSELEVQRSFKFQAEAYPGYSHARTLGNIEGGGGWKGEDRLARSYVFQSKEKKQQSGAQDVFKQHPDRLQSKKRKKPDKSDSSSDED